MVDETFTQRITSILRIGRSDGPSLSGDGDPIQPPETEHDEERDRLLRLAAAIAVIRARQEDGTDSSLRGRGAGTAYAQDHRRAILGLPNSLVARASRTTWR